MTGFRLLCCLCLLIFCCSTGFALTDSTSTAPTIVQLQQENTALQRKLKRLESQVAALREELNSPDATQIGGGIGYIVGLFGVAAWLAARKKTGQES